VLLAVNLLACPEPHSPSSLATAIDAMPINARGMS